MKIIILVPVYNDWKSVSKLIEEINSKVPNLNCHISIMIINDASTEKQSIYAPNLENIQSIQIINMKENRGHARCIASGLKYIYEKEEFDYIIPMDGDGEDRPEEIKNFVEYLSYDSDKPIVGERVKRSESLFFKFCYSIHKIITFAFTGKSIKFGNFTCLPKNHVKQLIQKPFLWNSYSSSIVKTINERTFIPSRRGIRYVLPSKMNFPALIFHSLAIISVFRNAVIIRSIIFLLLYIFLTFNNFSFLSFIPILFLIFFVLIILKISLRANMKEFEKSLENILSIDILSKSNNR